MPASFTEIQVDQISDNPFKLISADWMLITAGTPEQFNTMTASWGGLGHLWGRHVCFCFVRPQRYTFGFMNRAPCFTLSFFDESQRAALNYCGAHSGRDVDKPAATGLIPVAGQNDTVYFEQARLVLECRKLYAQDIKPDSFIDTTLPGQVYPRQDYHRMFIGEITRCLIK